MLATLLVLAFTPIAAQHPALIPMPESVVFTDSGFALPDTVAIGIEPATPRMQEIAGLLQSALEARGVPSRVYDAPLVRNDILLRIGNPTPNDESYRLTATSNGVVITGRAPAGVLWGVQTLRQLLDSTATGVLVPSVEIEDAPRFGWRGTMLDVGRHIFPVEYILRHLDWMSRYKFNVFHWHLTEDQGWRIAIDAYPLLTSVGAWRTEANGERYGGFYTRADVRRVVEHARLLGITVVPEIEMPGHSRAALAAYPELGCTNDTLPVPATWGVFTDVLCPGKESTFTFLKAVLTEVMALFPSHYIHIGGDEVPTARWEVCAACQEIIRREQLGDEHGLQRWMMGRISRWLAGQGRQVIGWDEILEGGVIPGATVQAWRGSDRIAAAIAAGADVIASPAEWLYLNRSAGGLPLDRVAMFDPLAEHPTGSGHLLGVEAPLWTEHVTSPANAELQWWPRLLAVAEVAWSGSPDSAEFRIRAERISARMRAEGVAVGPADHGLGSIRFEYDSASGGVRIVGGSAVPGIELVLASPGQPTRVVGDGDTLPDSGSWTLGARWHGASVGTPATIRAVSHLAVGRPIRLATPADPRYPGTGRYTLVDGIMGTTFNDGFWNGWQGPDLDATIDLGHDQPIHEVALSLLEDVNSWILYPPAVEVRTSSDGEHWQLVGRRELDLPVIAGASSRRVVRFTLPDSSSARWIRVVAAGGQLMPEWHPGAGGKAWIFADEIEVR